MKIQVALIIICGLLLFGLSVASKDKATSGVNVSALDKSDQAMQSTAAPSTGTNASEAYSPQVTGSKAGEQINWQVISGGGSIGGISDNYRLSGTAGQTAVGSGTAGDKTLNHGFWQDFIIGCCDTPGDANNDGNCNIGDEVFLGNFVFRSGQCDVPPGNPIGCPPYCMAEGDANGDGSINVADEVYLGNFIFRPPPASPFPECGPE